MTRSNVDELKHETQAAHDDMERLLEPARLRRLLIARLLHDEDETKQLIATIGSVRYLAALLDTGVLKAVRGDVEEVAGKELADVRKHRAILDYYDQLADGRAQDMTA